MSEREEERERERERKREKRRERERKKEREALALDRKTGQKCCRRRRLSERELENECERVRK